MTSKEMDGVVRCEWAGSPLLAKYHDEEWGVPERDDNRLFELLTLEGAQAGLSWEIVLKKREGYREAFQGFDVDRVAEMTPSEVEAIFLTGAVVRNRMKLESTVTNARAAIAVRAECGSLAQYLWRLVGDEPRVNRPDRLVDIPSRSDVSDSMAKELRRRGFKFVGTTICYAFMQASGMVDDHVAGCFRAI